MVNSKTRLVFSTDKGRLCPQCEKELEQCCCQQEQVLGDGDIRVRYETKGRKGKGVTVISGLPLKASEIKELAKKLKQKAGTGGSVKNACIEIQGEQRDLIKKELATLGWNAKVF